VNAFKCITDQKDTVTDSYSNAIIAFALTLARHPSRGEFLTRLRSKAIVKGLLQFSLNIHCIRISYIIYLTIIPRTRVVQHELKANETRSAELAMSSVLVRRE
jgi:hypothetical protein